MQSTTTAESEVSNHAKSSVQERFLYFVEEFIRCRSLSSAVFLFQEFSGMISSIMSLSYTLLSFPTL